MKTTPLILLSLVAGMLGGVAIAGAAGYGPLAYISYHLMTSTHNASVIIVPAYINLGNISPKQHGVISANATIELKENGTFIVKLLHKEKFEKVFSNLTIVLTIGKESVTLSLDHTSQNITLSSGNYTVIITVYYTVSAHPKGDHNVFKEPFIIIHPIGEEES